MTVKFSRIFIFIIIPILFSSSSIAAYNAFGSLISTNTGSAASDFVPSSIEAVDKTLHPLVRRPVDSNTIIGVMISPAQKIAYIRTYDGEEYFIGVGDMLGNADGSVTNINSSGIEVTQADDVISLPVRNRSVANENEE